MGFIDVGELVRARAQADVLFDLGMKCASGGAGDPDLVAAHKWFNLAAMRGNREAARYRGEIAAEMSAAQIAAAQRAARAWLAGERSPDQRAERATSGAAVPHIAPLRSAHAGYGDN